MQELASVTFNPDGNGHCLYHELIPLQELGRIKCTRASHLDFSTRLQVWEIRVPGRRQPVFPSPSRQECSRWERLNLEPKGKEPRHARAGRSHDASK